MHVPVVVEPAPPHSFPCILLYTLLQSVMIQTLGEVLFSVQHVPISRIGKAKVHFSYQNLTLND